MANCCNEDNRPRRWAGATSEMYIGARTLAPPMASPPRIRPAMKTPAEPAAPVRNALTRNKPAVRSMVGRRPRKSARVPARKAPTAQPSRTEATAKPVPAAPVPKAPSRAPTVPLTTPLSKPNRKPPTAATAAKALTAAAVVALSRPSGGTTAGAPPRPVPISRGSVVMIDLALKRGRLVARGSEVQPPCREAEAAAARGRAKPRGGRTGHPRPTTPPAGKAGPDRTPAAAGSQGEAGSRGELPALVDGSGGKGWGCAGRARGIRPDGFFVA